MRSTRRQFRGKAFTLLELVLVMVIICTALAIASPSLRGWSRASKLRDASDQFMATVRYARAQAISTSQVCRLTVDANGGTYQLSTQEGQNFVELGNDFGRVFGVPEGCRIEMTELGGKSISTVDFYPTGRTQPAHVKISYEELGETVEFECPTPAQSFAVVQQQQSR
jgi:type II secretion system protein H